MGRDLLVREISYGLKREIIRRLVLFVSRREQACANWYTAQAQINSRPTIANWLEHSLTSGYARLSGLLPENAAGTGSLLGP